MTVLFTQHWDIVPGKQQSYSDYVMTYYNPTLERIGIHLVGGYYVTIGAGPRVIAVGVTKDLHDLERALTLAEYRDVTDGLMAYIANYHSKILVPTGRVNSSKYDIQTGIWKFNQYWNIIPGMEKDYDEFIESDYLPTMEKIGIKVVGGWRVIVGSGPYIVSESSALGIVDIAKGIDTDEYRRVVRKLKTSLVTDYHSRVLAPTGRIDIPYFMGKMMEAL